MHPASLFPGLPGKSKPRISYRRWVPAFAICARLGCGEQFRTAPSGGNPTGRTIYCSLLCANRDKSGNLNPEERKQRELARVQAKARKRRMHLAAAGYDGIRDDEVLARDGWVCQMPVCLYASRRIYRSRKYPDPRSPSVDHIVPLSHGGSDTALNKRAAHLGCNIARGNGLDEQSIIDFGADLNPQPRVRRKRKPRALFCRICQQPKQAGTCPLHQPIYLLPCKRCQAIMVRRIKQQATCTACRTCTVPGCGRLEHAQQLCAAHYFRSQRHDGDPLASLPIEGDGTAGGLRVALLNRT